jgi:hypothetical protein
LVQIAQIFAESEGGFRAGRILPAKKKPVSLEGITGFFFVIASQALT